MTQPTLVSENAVDIYEVKEELKAIEKRDGELGFRAQRTKEYVETISQMTFKKAKDAKKALLELEIPRFKSEHAVKLIDVNPLSLDDLKQLLVSLNVTVKDDLQKKIFEILKAE